MPFFSNLLRGAGVARETAVTDGWMNLELQAKIAAHALLRGLVDAGGRPADGGGVRWTGPEGLARSGQASLSLPTLESGSADRDRAAALAVAVAVLVGAIHFGVEGALVAGWSDPALPTAVLDVPRLLTLAATPGTEP
mgnify:CR=1 FL=1